MLLLVLLLMSVDCFFSIEFNLCAVAGAVSTQVCAYYIWSDQRSEPVNGCHSKSGWQQKKKKINRRNDGGPPELAINERSLFHISKE